MLSDSNLTNTIREKFARAKQLQSQGKVAESIVEYRAVLALDKKYLAAWHQLAQLLEMQEKWDEAAEHYRKSIELDPQPPFWVYRHLGFALDRQEYTEEAIEAYWQAIELNPDEATTYSLLGQVQSKKGDFAGAIASYQKAVEIQPEQPFWVYLNLANLLVQNEEFEKAILAYREASRLNRDNPGVYRLLGEVQSQYGDVEGAIESYRKAIALNPKQPAFLYENLGDALLASHQKSEAIGAYRCAVDIQPDLPSVRQKLGELLEI